MKNGYPVAMYIGEQELPEDVVSHEYPIRQMRDILMNQYGYRKLKDA